MKRSKGKLCGKTRTMARGIKVITVNQHFKTFEPGESVLLKFKPKDMLKYPHARFNKKHGVIVNKQGNAYKVKLKDGNKIKYLDITPIHLERSVSKAPKTKTAKVKTEPKTKPKSEAIK